MSPTKDLRPRRRSPPVLESGRNYDCDSPCTSPPSLPRSMKQPKTTVKREKVTTLIDIGVVFSTSVKPESPLS